MASYWSALPYLSMHMYVHRGSQGILLETTKHRSVSADSYSKWYEKKKMPLPGAVMDILTEKNNFSIWKEF